MKYVGNRARVSTHVRHCESKSATRDCNLQVLGLRADDEVVPSCLRFVIRLVLAGDEDEIWDESDDDECEEENSRYDARNGFPFRNSHSVQAPSVLRV